MFLDGNDINMATKPTSNDAETKSLKGICFFNAVTEHAKLRLT